MNVLTTLQHRFLPAILAFVLGFSAVTAFITPLPKAEATGGTAECVPFGQELNWIENGGFEQLRVSDYSTIGWQAFGGPALPQRVAPPIPGWDVRNTAYQIELQDQLFGPAHTGTQYAEIDLDVSQTFDTIPGAVYQIAFAYSLRPDIPGQKQVMRVLVDNVEVGKKGVNVTPAGLTQTHWERVFIDFVAQSSQTTLTFVPEAGSVQGAGNLIDDVGVRALTPTCQCADGNDNDQDGAVDLADSGCENVSDNTESENVNLDVNKTVTSSTQAGDLVTYSFAVKNNGTDTATNVTAYDFFINGMDNAGNKIVVAPPFTFVSSSIGCNYEANNKRFVCPLGNIAAGQTKNFTMTFRSPDLQLCGTEVQNNVDVWLADGTVADWDMASTNVQCPEPKQCNDGLDNDNDGFVDLNDPGCDDANDDDETNTGNQCGAARDLLTSINTKINGSTTTALSRDRQKAQCFAGEVILGGGGEGPICDSNDPVCQLKQYIENAGPIAINATTQGWIMSIDNGNDSIYDTTRTEATCAPQSAVLPFADIYVATAATNPNANAPDQGNITALCNPGDIAIAGAGYGPRCDSNQAGCNRVHYLEGNHFTGDGRGWQTAIDIGNGNGTYDTVQTLAICLHKKPGFDDVLRVYQRKNIGSAYAADQARTTAFCDEGDIALGGGGFAPACDNGQHPSCNKVPRIEANRKIFQNGKQGWLMNIDLGGNATYDTRGTVVSCLGLNKNTCDNLPQCSDGVDNDGDGRVDLADPGCDGPNDDDETDPNQPQCNDGIDNDNDGKVDFPNDPGCDSPTDNDETDQTQPPQCSDGVDNDNDGKVDLADPGCDGPNDDDESDDPTATFTITKTDGRSVVRSGEQITYTVSITNTSNVTANNVTITDTLPSQVTFQAASSSGQHSNGIVTWSNKTIPANTVVNFTVNVQVNSNLTEGTTIRNRAQINGAQTAEDTSTVDNPQCNDGIDNDNDGKVDFPADPGCNNANDDNETDNNNNPQCSDGIDNDNDGKVDFPNDPGCDSTTDNDETDQNQPPQCSDGLDNDNDGKIDFPADPGCNNANDDNETDNNNNPQCSDGIDNDNDGKVDFPNDPGCDNANDDNEQDNNVPQCRDGIDNDGDGATDHPADFSCDSPDDDDETFPKPECNDGVDNDNDGKVDFPSDPGCSDRQDDNENNDGSADPNNITIDLRDSRDPVEKGDNYDYIITVSNLNNIALNNVSVDQSLDSDTDFISADRSGTESNRVVRWRNLSIPANGSITLRATVRVRNSADDGEILNSTAFSANKSDTETTRVEDDDDDDDDDDEDITLTITDRPDPVYPGETLEYNIRICNEENSGSRSIDVTAFLDPDTEFLDASDNGDEEGNDRVEWNNVLIGSDDCEELELEVGVEPFLRDGDRIRLRVRAEDEEDTEFTSVVDDDHGFGGGHGGFGGGGFDPVNATIDKRASRQEANVGDIINFTIELRNLSSYEARDVIIEDRFTSGQIAIIDAGIGRVVGNGLEWDIDYLAPDETRVFNYQVRVEPGMRLGDVISNSVTARSPDFDRTVTDVEQVRIGNPQIPQTGIGFFGSWKDSVASLRGTRTVSFEQSRSDPLGGILNFLFWASISTMGLTGGGLIGKRFLV